MTLIFSSNKSYDSTVEIIMRKLESRYGKLERPFSTVYHRTFDAMMDKLRRSLDIPDNEWLGKMTVFRLIFLHLFALK